MASVLYVLSNFQHVLHPHIIACLHYQHWNSCFIRYIKNFKHKRDNIYEKIPKETKHLKEKKGRQRADTVDL